MRQHWQHHGDKVRRGERQIKPAATIGSEKRVQYDLLCYLQNEGRSFFFRTLKGFKYTECQAEWRTKMYLIDGGSCSLLGAHSQ